MRRLLFGSLLVGAAIAAVPAAGATALHADGPPAPSGGPSLPVCVSADVGGLDLNQLCKDSGGN